MSITVNFLKASKEDYKKMEEMKKEINRLYMSADEGDDEKADDLHNEFYEFLDDKTVKSVESYYSQIINLKLIIMLSAGTPFVWDYISSQRFQFGLEETWRYNMPKYKASLLSDSEGTLKVATAGTFAYGIRDSDYLGYMYEVGDNGNILNEKNDYKLEATYKPFVDLNDISFKLHRSEDKEFLSNKEIRDILSKSNGIYIS